MLDTLEEPIAIRTIAEKLANKWHGYLDPSYPHKTGAMLVLPINKRLFISRRYNSGHKIIVTGCTTEEMRKWLTSSYDLPTAQMDTRRPIEDIARDIKRRVLDEMPPILERIEQSMNDAKDRYEATKNALARLKADFDPIKVHSSHDDYSSTATFTIYDLGNGDSVHGFIFSGMFTINRMNADGAIMAAIAREVKQRPPQTD